MKLNNQSFSYHFSVAPYEMSVPSRLTILIQNHVYVRLIYLTCAYMHMCMYIHVCIQTHMHRGWRRTLVGLKSVLSLSAFTS